MFKAQSSTDHLSEEPQASWQQNQGSRDNNVKSSLSIKTYRGSFGTLGCPPLINLPEGLSMSLTVTTHKHTQHSRRSAEDFLPRAHREPAFRNQPFVAALFHSSQWDRSGPLSLGTLPVFKISFLLIVSVPLLVTNVPY